MLRWSAAEACLMLRSAANDCSESRALLLDVASKPQLAKRPQQLRWMPKKMLEARVLQHASTKKSCDSLCATHSCTSASYQVFSSFPALVFAGRAAIKDLPQRWGPQRAFLVFLWVPRRAQVSD